MISQFQSIKTSAWFGMVQQTKESISRVLLYTRFQAETCYNFGKRSRFSEEKREKERVTPEFGEGKEEKKFYPQIQGVTLTDDLAKLQLPPLRLCACRRCLCPQLVTEQPKVRRLGTPLGEALGGLGKRGPQEPQRTPDVGLAADERRLGGAQICQILRKGSGASQRMP
jgi:hypothetical protein